VASSSGWWGSRTLRAQVVASTVGCQWEGAEGNNSRIGRDGSSSVVWLSGGKPYMCVVVWVGVWGRDVYPAKGRVTDAEGAEVLLAIALAFHAGNEARQGSGVG
jgi:hypothetical protein